MKRMLLFLLIVLAAGGTVFAQEDDSNAPVDALLWGADYFPYPDWDVYLSATPTEISTTWTRASEPFAVVFVHQRYWQETYIGEELSKFVDAAWLDTSLESYDHWRERKRCLSKSVLTIELETQFDGRDYESRFWIFSDEDVFVSVFAAYSPEQVNELHAMAAHFFPENASCEVATD